MGGGGAWEGRQGPWPSNMHVSSPVPPPGGTCSGNTTVIQTATVGESQVESITGVGVVGWDASAMGECLDGALLWYQLSRL